MNHAEHFGIAFANIVYAFLVKMDSKECSASVDQFFEHRWREKRALVAFLMKRKVCRDTANKNDPEEEENEDMMMVALRPTAKQSDGVGAMSCERNAKGQGTEDVCKHPGGNPLNMLELNMATDGVVTQLTVVRNAFLEKLLQSQQQQQQQHQQQQQEYTSSHWAPVAGSSFSFGSKLNNVTFGQIPVVTSGTLTDGEVGIIKKAVSSFCDSLKQVCFSQDAVWLATAAERGTIVDSSHHKLKCSQLMASVVEFVWTFSLSLLLAPKDTLFTRSGEYMNCGKRFSWSRCNDFVERRMDSPPRLSDSPPVFFLSQKLATSLESHFYDVLLNLGNGVTRPSGVYYLLLSRSCYEILGQLHEIAIDETCGRHLRAFSSIIKTARLSCRIYEEVKWESLIAETLPTLSNEHYSSLVCDLDFIWRWRQVCCREHSNDGTHVVDVAWENTLPCFLSEKVPSILTSQFQLRALMLASMFVSSKENGCIRGEKTMGEAFATLLRYTLHVCHIFNYHSGTHPMLIVLLELVQKMVAFFKKDKRLRGLATLALSGCLFSQPALYGTGGGYCRSSEQQKLITLQQVAERLMGEVEEWRKSRHSMWYSLSVSVLLGFCSAENLAQRLPSFFKDMGSLFMTSDSMDRIAILHSTLHAGGLLCDVCAAHGSLGHEKFRDSFEKFSQCVEKILLKVTVYESWREPQSSLIVAAASDLLIFTLQRGLFQMKACHWLVRLLTITGKTKANVRNGSSTGISCGQLIAMRTLSAFNAKQYSSCDQSILNLKGTNVGNSGLVCSSVIEDNKSLFAFYTILFDPKSSIREKIAGYTSVYRSCYSSVITTVEGVAVLWHAEDVEVVQEFLRSTNGFEFRIEELRRAAFEYLQLGSSDAHVESSLECSLHIVYVLLVARFWVPLHVMLDKSLTLPMLLVDPKTPLCEVVSRVVMPFYLNGDRDDAMLSCALALHRLVECIIISLGNEEDNHVEYLVEYMTSNLLILRDRMWCVVNGESCALKKEDKGTLISGGCQGIRACDGSIYNRSSGPQYGKWEWLLNAIDENALYGENFRNTLSDAREWCAIPALRGTSLIDTLEGLGVVLLGHSRQRVRRMALLQLDILASFVSLHKTHPDPLFSATEEPFKAADHDPHRSAAMSFDAMSFTSSYTDKVHPPRRMVADIFEELGEHFDKIYTSQRSRYVPLSIRSCKQFCDTRHYASESRVGMGGEKHRNGEYQNSTTRSHCHTYEIAGEDKRTLSLETPLASTSFGLHCMAEDSETPPFVFLSATALALMMYGYCPGSAAVRMLSVIAGEVVDRGVKRYMERSSSFWTSCYVLNFLLVLVDNAKSSPDANRLTDWSGHDHPGHQQGRNVPCDMGWQITNRDARYQQLVEEVALPLLLQELEGDSRVSQFMDMMQYLLIGPLDFVSTKSDSLVIFSGVVNCEYSIVTRLREILSNCNSKTRRSKRPAAQASLVILLPMLIIICRRHFLNPPNVPSRLLDIVATKRTAMEKIIQEVIDSILLGDIVFRMYNSDLEGNGNTSIDLLRQMLSEGNGVFAQSWLALPSSSSIRQDDSETHVNFEILQEMTLTIFLRGVFSGLIALVCSKDAKYLEPRFKSRLLPIVLLSLTLQVQWFLEERLNCQRSNFKRPQSFDFAMESCFFALQTVLSSLELSASSRPHFDHIRIISGFSERFFNWLQRDLPIDSENLENSDPWLFGLAVTLLMTDPSTREAVRSVLSEQYIGAPVHRTLFSMIVTALSAMWTGLKVPLLSHRCLSKVESYTRLELSTDTFSSSFGTLSRGENIFSELATTGSPIFFALAYLYEDDASDPVFDIIVRSKAQILLQLLCGETPNNSMGDPLDDWLSLMLKAYRQRDGEIENGNKLVQLLFETVSARILSEKQKDSFSTHLRHLSLNISLKILTLLVRRVEATEANLRTLLHITLSCQNATSEHVIAALWGGWIAYEGRERKRFVSVLVGSSMDLASKRIVANYIDSYIYEASMQNNKRDDSVEGYTFGAYYSFLLFSLHQMKLLRHNGVFSTQNNGQKSEGSFADSGMDSARDEGCYGGSTMRASRCFSRNESQLNLGINRNDVTRGRRVMWILDENIWLASLILTSENLKERTRTHRVSGGFTKELCEDSIEVRETVLIRPLVSVLFFTSWAMKRLHKRGDRLWRELQRDLGFATNLITLGTSNRRMSDTKPFTSSADLNDDRKTNNESNADELYALSVMDRGESESQSLLLTRCEATASGFVAASVGGALLERSETDSDNTVRIHHDIPETSFEEVVEMNMKSGRRVKNHADMNHTGTKVPSFCSLQRDISAMFLHLTCMLLVHLGCSEMHHDKRRDELPTLFHVVELSFDAFARLLGDAASEGGYYVSGAIKNWLKITFLRLKQCEFISPCDKERNNDATTVSSALIFDPTLLFGEVDLNGWCNNLPSSSVNIFLTELLSNISGDGKNAKGRHFLQRCLHESSMWLQREVAEEKKANSCLHILQSYIALLSMKVTRNISYCLSFTTGSLIARRNLWQMWMEETAAQLAEASVLRQLFTTLSSYIADFRKDPPTTSAESSISTYDHVMCTSILTSLGCLLRDIIVHEKYCCAWINKWDSNEMKFYSLMLATQFGKNCTLLTRYLLSCFWIGFAFLLTPETWSAACNLLAVFHRYGCNNFLGTILVPKCLSLELTEMSVTPDRMAAQLVLFQQGQAARGRHGDTNIIPLCGTVRCLSDKTGAALNYMREYATEVKESSLLLAFSELVLLCDWNSVDLEAYAPFFCAFSSTTNERRFENAPHSTLEGKMDSVVSPPPVFCSFSQCLSSFADAWNQSLMILPSKCEETPKNLVLRMAYVLRKFFLMALPAFGVPSIDFLLHCVAIKGPRAVNRPADLGKCWRSKQKDLFSVDASADMTKERGCLKNKGVLLFQNLFESLVVFPLMSLFCSSNTPLVLWTKILALVAALLQYHEQGHGFVTDLFLKFLDSLKRGLDIGTKHEQFTDETPFLDRLVVFVLVDDVLEKVVNLEASQRKDPSYASFWELKKKNLFEGVLGKRKLIATIVDQFVKDTSPTRRERSTAEGTAMQLAKNMSLNSVRSQKGPTNDIPRKEHDSDGMSRSSSPCSVGSGKFRPKMKCAFRARLLHTSHRFGVYAYGITTEANAPVQLLGQLPLDCYRSSLQRKLDNSVLIERLARNDTQTIDEDVNDVLYVKKDQSHLGQGVNHSKDNPSRVMGRCITLSTGSLSTLVNSSMSDDDDENDDHSFLSLSS